MNWATIKAGASPTEMPLKVLVNDRAIVTAGFANDVEAVNQYAAVIYNPTAYGTASARNFTQPRIVITRPKVATDSDTH